MAEEDELRSDKSSDAIESTPERPQHDDDTKPEQDTPLVKQAVRFLEEDEVKNASLERKRTFLLSKGLKESEIDALLMTNSDVAPRPSEGSEDKHRVAEPAPANAPPIITYPEFLLHSQKPTPLVTAQRLLGAAYLASGTAAIVYGTSKYIVEPMLGSLTHSRHSLFSTASSDLKDLNHRLEDNVSVIPSELQPHQAREQGDNESMSSDAAQYFSRTIATQTSPLTSRPPSSSSLPSDILPLLNAQHTSKLTDLRQALEDITPESANDRTLQESIEDFRGYLNQLPHFTNPAPAHKQSTTWKDGTSDDGMARMKAEIKGVKGALLSARNFPSSVVR